MGTNAKNLVNDLIKPLQEYRKAKEELNLISVNSYSSRNKKDNDRMDLENKFSQIRHKTKYEGEMTCIQRYEYWNDIIRAKAESISVIGGYDALQDICFLLREQPDNETYHYNDAFANIADGLSEFYY